MRSTCVSRRLALLVATTAPVALAQTRTDPAAAEALFNDAKALMRAGKHAEACPKLAESQRLDPAVGTQLALALCYENWGKLASAWVTYRDAAAAAHHASQPDRERIASDRAKALEGRLGSLTIVAPPAVASVTGLAVERDGIPMSQAAFGTATPVDAGEHLVTVKANGKKPFTVHATVANAEKKTVTLPELEDAPSSEPAPVASPVSHEPPAPEEGPKARRTVGIGLVGLAVVGAAFGTYFGVRALGASSDAKSLCAPGACPSHDDAVAKHGDAVTAANLANVSFAVGIVGGLTGAYLLLTSGGAPAPKERGVSAAASPTPGGAAASVTFRF